jgi:S1-C subfamily serine protease
MLLPILRQIEQKALVKRSARGLGGAARVSNAGIISKMAPGTTVYLATWRNGEARQITLTLGSALRRTSG